MHTLAGLGFSSLSPACVRIARHNAPHTHHVQPEQGTKTGHGKHAATEVKKAGAAKAAPVEAPLTEPKPKPRVQIMLSNNKVSGM